MSPAAKRHGEGPKSTPTVAEGRLFTLGISGILSCWDADSGKPLWQHDFSNKFKSTWPLFGTATSPMVEAGRLIVHVGGHDDGALAAFDPQTGQVAWQWDGDGPAYTSPIMATLHGTRQLITQSQGECIGVSATDGSLLWRFPFETQHVMNIVTPVVAGELVIFSGFRKGTMAYRLEKGQDQWSAEQVWHNPDVSMFMNSPVVVGERVLGLSQEEKGQFFCLDASSGKTLWTSDGRMGENAALLTAGDTVLALTTGSELIVFKASADRFQPLARYKVADTPTWAHPVIRGRKILIRDASSLALWTMGQ
jgi:outer membrane protein assembly factor BamB